MPPSDCDGGVAGTMNLDVWYPRLEIESVLEEFAPLVHKLHRRRRWTALGGSAVPVADGPTGVA